MKSIAIFGAFLLVPVLFAAPVPLDPADDTITDHKTFLPVRKHSALDGKVIGVLIVDPAAVLRHEKRVGPEAQLCFSTNSASYRWMYTTVEKNATIGTMRMPLPDKRTRAFDRLSMATPANVTRWDIPNRIALVEVEVNAGDGSGESDAFVVTDMKVVDGKERFPPKLDEVLADVTKRFEGHLSEQARTFDAKLQQLTKDKFTGPRERSTIVYATWLPESSRIQFRFLSRITDGNYRYAKGLRFEFSAPPDPIGPPQGGNLEPSKLPMGTRFGTQVGVEMGMLYEVGKSGKIEKQRPLSVETFVNEIPEPKLKFPPKK